MLIGSCEQKLATTLNSLVTHTHIRGWDINLTIIQGPSTSVQFLSVGIQQYSFQGEESYCTCPSYHEEKSIACSGSFQVLKASHSLLGYVPLPHMQSDFESLFGGSIRGAQLLICPQPKTSSLLLGKVVPSINWGLANCAASGGHTCLDSQIRWISPGDQWGDRCCTQIALTFQR